ncbi:MAG: hypothetical protein FRX49_09364 [Trebouxia sp. A1-2]|nr:MAG: hypothetical protein FRX49_09364 [Trebouxia sp. A1-2]
MLLVAKVADRGSMPPAFITTTPDCAMNAEYGHIQKGHHCHYQPGSIGVLHILPLTKDPFPPGEENEHINSFQQQEAEQKQNLPGSLIIVIVWSLSNSIHGSQAGVIPIVREEDFASPALTNTIQQLLSQVQSRLSPACNTLGNTSLQASVAEMLHSVFGVHTLTTAISWTIHTADMADFHNG